MRTRQRRMRALLLSTVIVLAGCSTTPQPWVEAWRADEQSNSDHSRCMQAIAPPMRVFSGPVYVLPKGNAFNTCMASKGYQLAKE
ncbi:MAG: hypothetical protein EPO02_00360 [Nitrospirae bacterium]|nr:MAG: hypothetical protein EPO02_00360 [Nitrospirota bacterium]